MHSADSYSCGGCRCSSPSRANSSNANWVWIALIFTAQRARPLVYYCHSLPHWIIWILFLRKRKVTLSVGAPEVQLECIALDSSNSRRRLARASSERSRRRLHKTHTTYIHTHTRGKLNHESECRYRRTSIVPCRMWSTSPFGREWHRFVLKNGTHSNWTTDSEIANTSNAADFSNWVLFNLRYRDTKIHSYS
jgi:hypothetical protein